MPEVFHRRVADGSVRQSLYQMRGEFLPGEIREDALARWVMSFDDLRQREGESKNSNVRESDSWPLDLIVTSTLQSQIPFYFAALFHIGRQWKVSESAVAALEKASTGENLRATAKLTFDILRARKARKTPLDALLFEHGPDVTTEALAVLLESSAQQHSVRLRESRQWWTEWREEVGSLRQQVNRIEELAHREFDYRLWREIAAFAVQGHRPSQLRNSMDVAGVKFPHQSERTDRLRPAAVYSELLWPLLLMTMSTSKFREPFVHELMFELRHVLHDVKEEIEYGELRRVALERLRQKYSHSKELFEPYLPLRKPATEDLRNLIIEHTLPGYGGRQNSPWLAAWKRCVEYNPATALKVSFKDVRDRKAADGFARSADSAIKDRMPDHFLPGETWDDFVQRLFEFAWVSNIADQIVETNKTLGDDSWSFESFAKMVERVVAVLNDLGYRLTTPSETRLKKLWDRLHGDKRWSDEEW
jgi:hypothetical protein